jgi:hypothetical protein
MTDFTLKLYRRLLEVLKENEYEFRGFEKFMIRNSARVIVLRHDVDKYPRRALKMAEIESAYGVRASYHFRAGTAWRNPEIIQKVVALGHELAYHYEDLSREARVCPSGDERLSEAFRSFRENLNYLRRFYPVKIASMHGDPLQPVDNRDLWEHFSYKSEGVICEPYLDIDYSSVLYLTDTGRRWNGSATNIRDKIPREKDVLTEASGYYRTTRDIISAINSGKISGRVILNIHPQRWTDTRWPWLKEFIWQNFKNGIKAIVSALR